MFTIAEVTKIYYNRHFLSRIHGVFNSEPGSGLWIMNPYNGTRNKQQDSGRSLKENIL